MPFAIIIDQRHAKRRTCFSIPMSNVKATPACRYSFAVMVIVLPVHMEFVRSGEFSVKDQLLAAARCVQCCFGPTAAPCCSSQAACAT